MMGIQICPDIKAYVYMYGEEEAYRIFESGSKVNIRRQYTAPQRHPSGSPLNSNTVQEGVPYEFGLRFGLGLGLDLGLASPFAFKSRAWLWSLACRTFGVVEIILQTAFVYCAPICYSLSLLIQFETF